MWTEPAPRRGTLFAAALALLFLPTAPDSAAADPAVPVEVQQVVDGDTVVVRAPDRRHRVRVLAVDTPELAWEDRPAQPWAEEAAAFTRDFLARCDEVSLQVAGDRRDEHGRTLAFLRCRRGGEDLDLSAELLRRGLARAVRFFQYPHKDRYLALEAQARGARRGLWGGNP